MQTISKRKKGGFRNAAYVEDLSSLEVIHQKEKNVAIYRRNVIELKYEVDRFLNEDLEVKLSGSLEEVQSQLMETLEPGQNKFPLLHQDVNNLLKHFTKISSASSLRLQIVTVKTDMCRRFHTDINDLRLLCTYRGKGTYWLPAEATNRIQYQKGGDNEEIVSKPRLIQQTSEGDILILKGALYPGAEAAIHRSPGIEKDNAKRMLLRIDTNGILNL